MYGRVVGTRRLTPGLIRLTLGGEGLDGFGMVDATDAYINVAIPPSGAEYGEIFDPREVRDSRPREQWPARRRYTVRRWDPELRLLEVDFVVHGDQGVAGPWAAAAREGTVLVFEGPAGGYRPDPDADWHLLVGDESALPAIAASLEVLPEGALGVVRLVCDGPDHEIDLPSPGRLDLRWLHRTGSPSDADLLVDSLREIAFPRGRMHAFVHGEADEIRAIRRHLLIDHGYQRSEMSCSPYWRRHMTDEAWREVKRDFVTAMEHEVA